MPIFPKIGKSIDVKFCCRSGFSLFWVWSRLSRRFMESFWAFKRGPFFKSIDLEHHVFVDHVVTRFCDYIFDQADLQACTDCIVWAKMMEFRWVFPGSLTNLGFRTWCERSPTSILFIFFSNCWLWGTVEWNPVMNISCVPCIFTCTHAVSQLL